MTGLVLVLLLVFLMGLSLWAAIDSALQPNRAYAEAGISRPWVTTMLLLGCTVGAVVYFAALRPRLVAARR